LDGLVVVGLEACGDEVPAAGWVPGAGDHDYGGFVGGGHVGVGWVGDGIRLRFA